MLGPRALSLDDMTGRWWVVQSRPNRERRLAMELADYGVDYFLPTVEVERVEGGRKRRKTILAIPMYIFVNGDEESRYRAAVSSYTTKIINVADQDRLTRELTAFENLMESDATAFDNQFVPRKGIRCVVKPGHPLAGCEGWIDSVGKQGVAVVSITMLGASRPVSIDPHFLEPLS